MNEAVIPMLVLALVLLALGYVVWTVFLRVSVNLVVAHKNKYSDAVFPVLIEALHEFVTHLKRYMPQRA